MAHVGNNKYKTKLSLQENTSLVTNFSDQKLLVTIVTNFYTNSQRKKIISY